jgi:hypothetical protein
MSYEYFGTQDLIALPRRSVQTFPSGLVRVDRSYVIRKDRSASVRERFAVGNELPLDNGYPAIDGAYIYPNVQENQRDDGFYEFGASAYGRTNADYQHIQKRPRVLSLRNEPFGIDTTYTFTVFEFTAQIVLPTLGFTTLPDANQFADTLGIQDVQVSNPSLVNRFELLDVVELGQGIYNNYFYTRATRDYRLELVRPLDSLGNPDPIRFSVSFKISDPIPKVIEQRNFGQWSEYLVDFGQRFIID